MMSGMQGIIVFEANNDDFKARKRAAKACLSCQKKKKRCTHTFESGDSPDAAIGERAVATTFPHKESLKFVGDTNPESILERQLTRNGNDQLANRIGNFGVTNNEQREAFHHSAASEARVSMNKMEADVKKNVNVQKYREITKARRSLPPGLKQYLLNVGAMRQFTKETQEALIKAYIKYIDPLLPIIDCDKLLKDHGNGTMSIFLMQAIALVACKVPETRQYLRIEQGAKLIDPIPFAHAVHSGLDAAMKAELEHDRFVKVQILTLMSLHNDGPGGIEESSMRLVMAIHDAQTTGLHINTPGRTRNDQPALLWWTLWTLDKFNACLGGRPLMIADRDIDIERPAFLQDDLELGQILSPRERSLAVWMAMGDLLDKVIEFYRPTVAPDAVGWENPFPEFQSLIDDSGAGQLNEMQHNLLDVCYNIIGILACRAGGPSSNSYKRRTACADRIQELTTDGKHLVLPPLPLVPYAVSLSLTVAYRGLRDSYADPGKTAANLAARCDILESLHRTWWTADAMAKLGRRALRSLEQPPASTDMSEAAKTAVAGILASGDALESEVAVCKYGPFNASKKRTASDHTIERRSRPSSANSMAYEPSLTRVTSNDNGLQVLSHAAASLVPPNQMSNMSIDETSTSRSQGTKSPTPNTKRARRFFNGETHARHLPQQLQHQMNNRSYAQPMINFSATSSPQNQVENTVPTLANTPATEQTPASITSLPTQPNLQPQQQSYLDTHPSTQLDSFIPLQSHTPTQVHSLTSPPTLLPNDAPDPLSLPLDFNSTFDSTLDYGFDDLDNLFDGFFDLSCPTMFEDKIYHDWTRNPAYYTTNGFGGAAMNSDGSINGIVNGHGQGPGSQSSVGLIPNYGFSAGPMTGIEPGHEQGQHQIPHSQVGSMHHSGMIGGYGHGHGMHQIPQHLQQ